MGITPALLEDHSSYMTYPVNLTVRVPGPDTATRGQVEAPSSHRCLHAHHIRDLPRCYLRVMQSGLSLAETPVE